MAKANWYYYNESDGEKEKIGPFESGVLKQLTQQGVITPETFIEDPSGRTGLARDVKGLAFPDANPSIESAIFSFRCPTCNCALQAKKRSAGKTKECPTCKTSFTVPSADVLPSTPSSKTRNDFKSGLLKNSADQKKLNENTIPKLDVTEEGFYAEIAKADNRCVWLHTELETIEANRANLENQFSDYAQSLNERFVTSFAPFFFDTASRDKILEHQEKFAQLKKEDADLETEHKRLETQIEQRQESLQNLKYVNLTMSDSNPDFWHGIGCWVGLGIVLLGFIGAVATASNDLGGILLGSIILGVIAMVITNVLIFVLVKGAKLSIIGTKLLGKWSKQGVITGLQGKTKWQQQTIRNKQQELQEHIQKGAAPLIRAAEQEKQRKLAAFAQERSKVISQFQSGWHPSVQPLKEMVSTVRLAQPPLNSLSKEHQNTSGVVPDVLVSGHTRLSLPSDVNVDWQLTVPNLFEFPFNEPIVGGCNRKRGRDALYKTPGEEEEFERDCEEYDVKHAWEFGSSVDTLPFHRLLLRLLFTMPVGTLKMTVIDPMQTGRSLAPFFPLTEVEEIVPLKKFLTESDEIERALKHLYDYVNDVTQKRLHGKHWRDYNEANPDNKLPYQLLFVFGFPDQCTAKSISYLNDLIEYGPACGVLPIITLNYAHSAFPSNAQEVALYREYQGDANALLAARGTRYPATEVLAKLESRGRTISELYSLERRREVLLPERFRLQKLGITEESEWLGSDLTKYLEWIKSAYVQHKETAKIETAAADEREKREQATVERRKKETALEDEFWHPQDLWNETATKKISVPIGKDNHGNVVAFDLNDSVPHCLLAGQSGSGKSVLLHVIIQGLAHRYSPDELEFYLMDYKDGIEFNRYAKTQIPHTRLVVASKAEAEYGITVLGATKSSCAIR